MGHLRNVVGCLPDNQRHTTLQPRLPPDGRPGWPLGPLLPPFEFFNPFQKNRYEILTVPQIPTRPNAFFGGASRPAPGPRRLGGGGGRGSLDPLRRSPTPALAAADGRTAAAGPKVTNRRAVLDLAANSHASIAANLGASNPEIGFRPLSIHKSETNLRNPFFSNNLVW
jgi:hypothetical protein